MSHVRPNVPLLHHPTNAPIGPVPTVNIPGCSAAYRQSMFMRPSNAPGLDKIDLTSVTSCFSGGAPLPPDVLERFEVLTGSKIVEGYGLTETSPVTHANPLNGRRKIGSIGVPVPNTDEKVVSVGDPSTEVPLGTQGELLLKGPQVMREYWNAPDESAAILTDGWLHTGDIATIDEDGYCFLVGRKKDMIIAGGYNIYPDEVDTVLMAHPAVHESATIGVPDPERGETVKSFVALRPGETASADDLITHCRLEALLHESELARIDPDPRLLHRPMRYDIGLPSPVI